MKKLILLLGIIISAIGLNAQKYNTIAGVRIADDFGLTFSQRIANKNTIELNHQPGTFAGKQMTSLLVKQHYPLLSKRLNFFMGAGLYTLKSSSGNADIPQVTSSTGLALSFGAEFSIGRLNIATDYLPLVTINKSDSNQRFYTTSGFSLRYILGPAD